MEVLSSNKPEEAVFIHPEVKIPPNNSINLWEEVRTSGYHPSRRSYHSAVMWKDKMVIYGGQDLKKGPQSGMWALEITQFDQGEWESIPIQDNSPLCRHTAILRNDLMYLFGGIRGTSESNITTVINLTTLETTTILPELATTPPPLDSHTACLYETSSGAAWMIVFGGFSIGERSKNVYSLNLISQKWKQAHTSAGPEPRSSHAAVIHTDSMFVFGGTNDEGEKINELWRLDLRTYVWESIKASGDLPNGRSGHSMILYNNFIIVFGGMKDVTKETNDMYSYELNKNTWTLFQKEQQIKDHVSDEQVEEFKKSRASPKKKLESNSSKGTISKRSTYKDSPTRIMRKVTDNLGGEAESPKRKKTNYEGPARPIAGRLKSRPPHSRDGHSALCSENTMIIFGGDRHQMPFNDCYVYFLVESTLRASIKSI